MLGPSNVVAEAVELNSTVGAYHPLPALRLNLPIWQKKKKREKNLTGAN